MVYPISSFKLFPHFFLFLFAAAMLAMPESLEVTASSPSSLRVRWRPAHGATQYMALYSALTDGEPDDAREVNRGVSSVLMVVVTLYYLSFNISTLRKHTVYTK